MLCDLHIHSCYSDSTLTPQDIIQEASALNLGLISVTDHNSIAVYDELIPLAQEAGIQLVTGVELDCAFGGKNFHVLGYHFDLANAALLHMIEACKSSLLNMSTNLISKMEKDFPTLSLEEFLFYRYEPTRGGWAGLNYLLDKGIAQNYEEAKSFYSRYGVTYETAGFPNLVAVCNTLHKAGGVAVLAHPGDRIENSILLYLSTLGYLIKQGLDGVECYYPSHSSKITRLSLDLCSNKGLNITCGSDTHGEFCKELKGVTYTMGAACVDSSILKLEGIS